MVGPVPAREDEAARLTGARGDFVANLGRRLEALRVSLRAVEQTPSDGALRNGLLRRVHALASSARVLGFASVAEALAEAEKRLRKSEFSDVARALDLLPSLLLGMPVSLRPGPNLPSDRAPTRRPLSILVFGPQALLESIQAIPGTHVECERSEELTRARELARIFGPDLAVIDADLAGARELVEGLTKDPKVEPLPLLIVGEFASPEAASAYQALGATRVLAKPLNSETLQRAVVELPAQSAEARTGREPLGDLSMAALADRIALEVRRGLLEAAEPSARATSVAFGDGTDVMAAVWGAVARVRELVTLRSSGAVRFDATGPEGAVPIVAWSGEERRAGERSAGGTEARVGESVSLQGRRIVIADDDPAVVWFMSGLLKALGVEVLEAHDGARALALAYDSWPDLVVSDVLMPKLDGFSLCHEIKRDVAVRDVPVILLSWKEDLLQRVRELGASADGYLRKEAAATTVAERLREVLRPRARVEQRIAAGGEARGRLDGLTPRLILELAAAGKRDVRVGFRDAVYLYEAQIRGGRLCSATRSSADGSFERGEFVLAALLGVSAGRFVVVPDSSSCRADFDGTVAQVLKAPIERARAALNSIGAGALASVTRVQIAAEAMASYLACTPDPARGLLDKLIGGSSPRELITSGASAPRLLEAVLSDVARRGALLGVDRIGEAPRALYSSEPPLPPEPAARSAAVPPEPALAEPALPPQSAASLVPARPPQPALPIVSVLPPEESTLHPPPSFLPEPPLVSASVAPAKFSLTPSLAPKVDDVNSEDAGWFSLRLDSSHPPPAPAASPAVPLPAVALPPVAVSAVAAVSAAVAQPVAPPPVPPRPPTRNVESKAKSPAPNAVSRTAPEPSIPDPPALAPAVAEKPKGLPFSSEVTPAADRWEKLTEGVFSYPGTLQGVGMPEVTTSPVAVPAPLPAEPPVAAASEPLAPARKAMPSVEELDALASALTETPSPSPVAAAAPLAAVAAAPKPRVEAEELPPGDTAAALPTTEAPAAPSEAEASSAPSTARVVPEELKSTLVSRTESQPPLSSASRVSPLKTPTPSARVPAPPGASVGSLVWLVFVAATAFAVAYFVITYYRLQSAPNAGAQPTAPAPLPATS
ncbi:MAG TPA: response regulator [Polyangiaceae bacterium]|nr:response regulator [Polyangiaceae bacterium]